MSVLARRWQAGIYRAPDKNLLKGEAAPTGQHHRVCARAGGHDASHPALARSWPCRVVERPCSGLSNTLSLARPHRTALTIPFPCVLRLRLSLPHSVPIIACN